MSAKSSGVRENEENSSTSRVNAADLDFTSMKRVGRWYSLVYWRTWGEQGCVTSAGGGSTCSCPKSQHSPLQVGLGCSAACPLPALPKLVQGPGAMGNKVIVNSCCRRQVLFKMKIE